MSNIKYWYLGGDIHGDWRPVRNWVVNKLPTPRDKSALILLGDVGANYYLNKRDREFKEQLNKLGIKIYCLRGNHEMRVKEAQQYGNYSQVFDVNVNGPITIESSFSNIRYLQDDGGIYKINDSSILVAPGAYSVDKYYRLAHGWNWFANEQLTTQEQQRLLGLAQNNKIDYILAHSCPYSWEGYIDDLFISGLDQNEIDKTTEKFLDMIIEQVPDYKHFYFGHFHNDRDLTRVNATMLYKEFIPFGEYLTKQVDS